MSPALSQYLKDLLHTFTDTCAIVGYEAHSTTVSARKKITWSCQLKLIARNLSNYCRKILKRRSKHCRGQKLEHCRGRWPVARPLCL